MLADNFTVTRDDLERIEKNGFFTEEEFKRLLDAAEPSSRAEAENLKSWMQELRLLHQKKVHVMGQRAERSVPDLWREIDVINQKMKVLRDEVKNTVPQEFPPEPLWMIAARFQQKIAEYRYKLAELDRTSGIPREAGQALNSQRNIFCTAIAYYTAKDILLQANMGQTPSGPEGFALLKKAQTLLEITENIKANLRNVGQDPDGLKHQILQDRLLGVALELYASITSSVETPLPRTPAKYMAPVSETTPRAWAFHDLNATFKSGQTSEKQKRKRKAP